MELTHEQDQRANRATAFSMLLAFVLVIYLVWTNVSLWTALGMMIAGFALQGASNLMCLAIAKAIIHRRPWALLIIRFLWPLVPVAIGIAMAGYITLFIQGCRLAIVRFF
jgi:hypothetical protein